MDVYTLSTDPELARRPNTWTRTEEGAAKRDIGEICTIKESLHFVKVLYHSQAYSSWISPANFWEVINA